jgi:hypothetical protein
MNGPLSRDAPRGSAVTWWCVGDTGASQGIPTVSLETFLRPRRTAMLAAC